MKDIRVFVERPKVIWRQVADQVRSKIYKGELAPGMRLPSTAALAAQVGADVRSVHRALTDLVREGLITRTRKVGTYVSEKRTQLSRLGIYHSADIHGRLTSAFIRCLHEELQRQMYQRDVHLRIWIDQRSVAEQGTVLPDIESASRERVIEGLISTIGDRSHRAWMAKLKVPTVHWGSDSSLSNVSVDTANFWHLAFQHFKENGCRSVGVISSCPRTHPGLKPYLELAAAYGLSVSQDWMICPPRRNWLPDSEHANFGYRAVQTFWAKSVKPRGLVVYPDGVVPGVVLAIMAAHVRVPEELQLVFHKNEGIDYFCPVPVTYVTSSVPKIAAALLRQIDELSNGRSCQQVLVDHYLSF